MRDVLLYSVLRIAVLAAVWWLLMQFGLGFGFAGIGAALIAMLLSILFLRRPRQAAAERWQAADERRREKRHATGADIDHDAEDEDALLDATDSETPAEPGPASQLPEDPQSARPTSNRTENTSS